MNNVKLYSEANPLQRAYTKKLLEEYAPKISWKKHGDRTIDIGCGDGGVTCEILRRYLPENYELLVGCDISPEMVEHASRHYSDHRTQFLQLDIEDYIPKHFLSNFDHAFSFFVFHWTNNYQKSLENTYKLLERGGDCLFIFVGSAQAFTAQRIMGKVEKWREFVGDVERYISPFQDLLKPELEVRSVMEKISFKNIDVKAKNITFEFKDMETMKNAMTAINPFIKFIPKHMRDEFIDTYMHLICTHGLPEEDEQSQPMIPTLRDVVLITVYATK